MSLKLPDIALTPCFFRATLAAILAFLFIFPEMSAQKIWFVKPSASGNQTGEDWQNAFTHPQDAFDIAGDGDMVYIQSGLYLPVRNLQGQTNDNFQKDYTFLINKSIKVYGSFAGHELSHFDREFSTALTIFSGDLSQNDILVDDPQDMHFPVDNNFENVYHVLTWASNVSAIHADGIQVIHGNANSSASPQGAGIFIHNDGRSKISIDLHRCYFSRNVSGSLGAAIYIDAELEEIHISRSKFEFNTAGRFGAGLYIKSSGNALVQIRQSHFEHHHAIQGAALFMEVFDYSSLEIDETDFLKNTAIENGAAIHFATLRNTSTFKISNARIEDNSAAQGGALFMDQSDMQLDYIKATRNNAFDGGFSFSTGLEEYKLWVSESEFADNNSDNTGAGFAALNAGIELRSSTFKNHKKPRIGGVFYLYHTVPKTNFNSIFVDKCSFEGNAADRGAVFFEAAVNQFSNKDNALFLRSSFRRNESDNGAVFCLSHNVPNQKVYSRSFYSCVFNENKAKEGAIIHYESTAPANEYFLNCTFYNNKASSTDPLFFIDIDHAASGKTKLDIINSILWKNTAPLQDKFIASNPDCSVTLYHSLIDNASCEDLNYQVNCTNNIYNEDPLFFNALAGDLRLRVCSPAIDKGDNDPVYFPAYPFTDILSKIRIIDQIVDMGAYEVPKPYFASDTIYICPGDSVWTEALGWIKETGLYFDTLGILNGCVDEHAYFALKADTIDYNIFTTGGDCKYEGIEIRVSSTADIKFDWRKSEDILGTTGSIKIQSPGWYYLSASGENFCPMMDSIFIDSIPRMPIFTSYTDTINCMDNTGQLRLESTQNDFRVIWEGPSGISGNSAILTTSEPGIYTAIVRDALDCPYTFELELIADTLSPAFELTTLEFDPCNNLPRTLIAHMTSEQNPVLVSWSSHSGQWEAGTNPNEVIALSSGMYHFQAQNAENGCTHSDSIEVRMGSGPINSAEWLRIENGCGSQYTYELHLQHVSGGIAPYSLKIDQEVNNPDDTIKLNQGNHLLEIKDWAGCTWDSTILVEAKPQFFLELGDNRFVRPGTVLEIKANTDTNRDNLNFAWNDENSCAGCDEFNIQIWSDTTIYVSASLNPLCVAFDSINIFILEDPRIFVPTAFSPNGDGINDLFELYPGSNIASVRSLRILNRWGNIVFEHTQKGSPSDIHWDGNFKSQLLEPQVLVWSMQVEMKNGTIHQLQGELSLIR